MKIASKTMKKFGQIVRKKLGTGINMIQTDRKREEQSGSVEMQWQIQAERSDTRCFKRRFSKQTGRQRRRGRKRDGESSREERRRREGFIWFAREEHMPF